MSIYQQRPFIAVICADSLEERNTMQCISTGSKMNIERSMHEHNDITADLNVNAFERRSRASW